MSLSDERILDMWKVKRGTSVGDGPNSSYKTVALRLSLAEAEQAAAGLGHIPEGVVIESPDGTEVLYRPK